MHVLISGGPGAGCTSTAELIGVEFDLQMFDSDVFFHKPTNPPFQEQYSSEERRELLSQALDSAFRWVVSGSIGTWGVDLPQVQFGIFLNIPTQERIRRLHHRERLRFGSRIDAGGDMFEENKAFIEWATGYDERTGLGRNLPTDRDFLIKNCQSFLEISDVVEIDEVLMRIRKFLMTSN